MTSITSRAGVWKSNLPQKSEGTPTPGQLRMLSLLVYTMVDTHVFPPLLCFPVLQGFLNHAVEQQN